MCARACRIRGVVFKGEMGKLNFTSSYHIKVFYFEFFVNRNLLMWAESTPIVDPCLTSN